MRWEHLTPPDFKKLVKEKGKKLLELLVPAVAEKIARIKEDKTIPALQKEFTDRVKSVQKAEWEDIF